MQQPLVIPERRIKRATPEEVRQFGSRTTRIGRHGRDNRNAVDFGGIDPTIIFGSSLELWLRADLGITLNGSNVSAWADQSGSADNGGGGNHHPTQGTASQQPLWNASDGAYSGRSTISFAAASSQVLASPIWTTPPATIGTHFVVGNTDNAAISQVFIELVSGGNGELYMATTNDIRYFQGADLSFVGEVTPASPHVYGIDRNGANTNCYQDNITALNTGPAGSTALQRIFVGANSAAGGAPLNGKIAEVISINRLATLAERTATMKYLGNRYGIAIGA